MYTRKSDGANEIHYLTKDHLGSVDSVSNAAGAVEVRLSFGSFGQRRKEAGWSGLPTSGDWTQITNTTRRGFTEHEMLDNLNLVHMNGRVYDQVAGRFLSADPFVQAPGFTQSFNRYNYTFNNPLTFTDPSGFQTSWDRWQPQNGRRGFSGTGFGGACTCGRTEPPEIEFDRGPLPARTFAPLPRWPSAVDRMGSFFDAYFDRVGGMLYGMADSFKITGEAGPQIKASFTALSFKPELTIGNFSGYLSLSGALDPEVGVKSPSFGDLYYGEASLSLGKFKVGAALDSVTEGMSMRRGPFQRVEEGFFGKTTVTTWKGDFGKVGGHVQIFFGVKAEWDWYKFFKSIDDAFDP